MNYNNFKGWAFVMAIMAFCVTVWFLFLWGTGVIDPQV